MQCFVIDANTKTILEASLTDVAAPIAKHIGYDSIDSDEIDGTTDRLYFDDSCFIRTQPSNGRFKFDSLAPLAGIGVVAGVTLDGSPTTPKLTLQEVKARVTFVS
jgi:hypothetical protein